ncbi:obscurin-like, partial [Astyanax mexicanus]
VQRYEIAGRHRYRRSVRLLMLNIFVFLCLEAAAAFSNKDSYQREVKVSASQKATLSCEVSDMKTEVKVSASQKATLSCEVSDMKTEVKWYKDGKQLSSSRTVHMETKGKSRQLVLDSVEKKDAGEYTCEAGNEKLTFKILCVGHSGQWSPEI